MVMTVATPMARIAPLKVEIPARLNMRALPCTMPWAMARIGLIRGATSIAPIMTAALSSSRPRMAMAAANEMRAMKSTLAPRHVTHLLEHFRAFLDRQCGQRMRDELPQPSNPETGRLLRPFEDDR